MKRRKDVGARGNGGQFATHQAAEADVTLTAGPGLDTLPAAAALEGATARLARAKAAYAAADRFTILPSQRRARTEAGDELLAAQAHYDRVSRLAIAQREDAWVNRSSATVDYAPSLRALDEAKQRGLESRREAAWALTGNLSTTMAPAGLRQWDEIEVDGPNGVGRERAVVTSDPRFERDQNRPDAVVVSFDVRAGHGRLDTVRVRADEQVTVRMLDRG